MKNGSSLPKFRKNLSSLTSQAPTPSDDGGAPPDADTELERLAKGSLGTSAFSGYRGLLQAKGRKKNSEDWTLGGGLEHFGDDPRDQRTQTEELFRREGERQAQLAASLDKAGSGPTGGRKAQAKSGEPTGPPDNALYGK